MRLTLVTFGSFFCYIFIAYTIIEVEIQNIHSCIWLLNLLKKGEIVISRVTHLTTTLIITTYSKTNKNHQ